MKLKFFIFVLFIALFNSCNHGIAPIAAPEVNPGFSGKVTFKGTWPTDVAQTYVVLFKNPLKDSSDFNMFNLNFVSAPIPQGSKEFTFSTEDPKNVLCKVEPGQYAYLAVAQQKKAFSFNRKDWFVAGVYYPNGDTSKAGEFILPENTFLKNVDILCDFDHPPVQPPGGKALK